MKKTSAGYRYVTNFDCGLPHLYISYLIRYTSDTPYYFHWPKCYILKLKLLPLENMLSDIVFSVAIKVSLQSFV